MLSSADLQFEAYDCSAPRDLTTLNMADPIECNVRLEPQMEKEVNYTILQQVDHVWHKAIHCKLRRYKMVFYCGVYGHAELLPHEWEFGEDVALEPDACAEA